jgi:hypothetical protein
MFARCLIVLVLAIAICGCASRGDKKPPTQATAAPQPSAPARASYDSMRSLDYSSGGLVPPMQPSRKINDQDCTKDIDLTGGNLRCR